MKYHVQFTLIRDRVEREILGSDGVFILDGRNNLDTMINDAVERAERIKNVIPGITGFKIMKGERFCGAVCIYKGMIK